MGKAEMGSDIAFLHSIFNFIKKENNVFVIYMIYIYIIYALESYVSRSRTYWVQSPIVIHRAIVIC